MNTMKTMISDKDDRIAITNMMMNTSMKTITNEFAFKKLGKGRDSSTSKPI